MFQSPVLGMLIQVIQMITSLFLIRMINKCSCMVRSAESSTLLSLRFSALYRSCLRQFFLLCAQAGARALSRELASPPIEVVLVEAAVAIIRLCRPPGSAEEGQPVAQVVPAAVMSFLRRRVSPHHFSFATTLPSTRLSLQVYINYAPIPCNGVTPPAKCSP